MNDLETRRAGGKLCSIKEVSLRVLYQDDVMVVIDKPSGLMTHKSRIAEDDELSAMERIRDQLGAWVYPVHRLDRATSGVLVFGLNQNSARTLHESFARGDVHKTYWAVTRGHGPRSEFIDRPLKEKRDRVTDKKAERDKAPQEARTTVKTLAHCELDVPLGRYQSARFSLIEAQPHTGRRHQLRRHLAGINYPIIGDTTHGRGEQNRFFRAEFNSHRLLLAAVSIKIPHPLNGEPLFIEAPLNGVMSRVCQSLFLDKGASSNLCWLSERKEHLHLFAADQA